MFETFSCVPSNLNSQTGIHEVFPYSYSLHTLVPSLISREHLEVAIEKEVQCVGVISFGAKPLQDKTRQKIGRQNSTERPPRIARVHSASSFELRGERKRRCPF